MIKNRPVREEISYDFTRYGARIEIHRGRYEWFLDQPEDIATYSYDGFLPQFVPDAVLVPENAKQISQIMKAASRM
jgi:FAD/FMN-containing dehydrogenase